MTPRAVSTRKMQCVECGAKSDFDVDVTDDDIQAPNAKTCRLCGGNTWRRWDR